MDDNKKACWNCRWYSPVYTKGYHHFDRQNFGTCRHNKPVQKHDCCEDWQYNTELNKHIGRQFRREAALKALNEILQHLAEVSQILKEEHEGID